MTRPTHEIPSWNPDESKVDIPDSGQQSAGFALKQKLSSKYLNWFWKRISSWLGWIIPWIDNHRNTEARTFTDFDEGVAFLANLKHNDFTITISGSKDDPTYDLSIAGISGNGFINFTGNPLVLGSVAVEYVSNSVTIAPVSSGTFYTRKRNAITARGCPELAIPRYEGTQDAATSFAGDRMLRVLKNSMVRFSTSAVFDSDGHTTGTNMVEIDESSSVKFLGTSSFIPPDSDPSGGWYNTSVINCQGKIAFTTHPSFAAHWHRRFATQLEATEYPYSTDPFLFHMPLGSARAECYKVLEKIKAVHGGLRNLTVTEDVADLDLRNISGSGYIHFTGCTFVTDNHLEKVRCQLIFQNCSFKEQSVSGKYGALIVDCPDVVMPDETKLMCGTENYPALRVEATNLNIEDLRVLNPVSPTKIYFEADDMSRVNMGRVVGGHGLSVVTFGELDNGSQVSVGDFNPNTAESNALRFVLNGASTQCGWDGTKYVIDANVFSILEI